MVILRAPPIQSIWPQSVLLFGVRRELISRIPSPYREVVALDPPYSAESSTLATAFTHAESRTCVLPRRALPEGDCDLRAA